jgi:hypothetical protein
MTSSPAVLVSTATVVTMIVGTLIPTAVSGVVAGIVAWPSTGPGWEQLVLNVLMTFATAASADPSLWRGQVKADTYVATIHTKTDKFFGVGQYDEDLAYAA